MNFLEILGKVNIVSEQNLANKTDQFPQIIQELEINNHLLHAINLQECGEYDLSKKYYLEILNIDNFNAIALNNLSLLSDSDSARSYLSRTLMKDPQNIDANINAIARLIDINQIQNALILLNRLRLLGINNETINNLNVKIKKLSENKTAEPYYSIILPTHNRPKLLERALLSIRQQSSKYNYEIIVISDCNNNENQKICEKILKTSDKYIERNGQFGPSESRNLALEKVTGQVVLFLDDDDSWHPNLLNQLDKSKNLINELTIYFDCSVVKEIRNSGYPKILSETVNSNAGRLNRDVFLKNQVHMSCFAFPKKILKNIYFDRHMRAYEDWDFLLSVFERQFPSYEPILGSRVHEVDDTLSDRRGASLQASDFNAVLDYLYVYRRHPVESHYQSLRSNFLSSFGINIEPKYL